MVRRRYVGKTTLARQKKFTEASVLLRVARAGQRQQPRHGCSDAPGFPAALPVSRSPSPQLARWGRLQLDRCPLPAAAERKRRPAGDARSETRTTPALLSHVSTSGLHSAAFAFDQTAAGRTHRGAWPTGRPKSPRHPTRYAGWIPRLRQRDCRPPEAPPTSSPLRPAPYARAPTPGLLRPAGGQEAGEERGRL